MDSLSFYHSRCRCLFIASFVLHHVILYIVSDAGHDGELYRSPHTLCVIKFVDCVSTWIQIIWCGTMGFWCGTFFSSAIPHRPFSAAFFRVVLFVLLNLFGLLLLLVSSNQTRIQRNASVLKRIGWFFLSHLDIEQTITKMMAVADGLWFPDSWME